MYDPIGGFLRIRELYLTYLETAFRIGDPLVSAERRELLERAGTLCTDPLLEPLPRYRTVDWKLRDLPALERGPLEGLGKDDRETFVRLVSAGLFENDGVNLYRHQAEMLQRGSNVGQPGIVTSGTGSGKTESFLLPVLATISREARGWPKPATHYLQEAWWHDANGRAFESFSAMPQERRPLKKNPDADPFVPHRDGENRTAAVRCLILYPMNALVEDQLARLRKALDSERVRSEMDEHIGGNRIFFGRYTSDTPVTGFNIHPRTPAIDDYKRRGRQLKKLFEEMVQYERAQRKVNEQAEDSESEFSEDDRYLFPSVNGSELLSRWDMQTYPPDILITNVSMLGAMLNREVDAPIFDATRDWLASNDDAYFFLVLDELHLQRGAAGTEVAYLLRQLLQRLGLTDPAHRHKLRILASSASLPTEGAEGKRSQTYLWDMFGSLGTWTSSGGGAKESKAWRDSIVTGETEPENPNSTHRLPKEPFQAFVRRYGGTRSDPACTGETPVHEREWRQVASALRVPSDEAMPELVRGSIEEAGRRLAAACWSDDDRRARATGVVALSSALFGAADLEAREALRGLLLVRGLGDAFSVWFPDEAKAEPLGAPSFRLHTFFRSIEGLYAPLDRGKGVDESFRSTARMVGTLSLERAISEETEGRSREEKELPLRLFELLYCECCGELFVGGMRRKRATNEFELLPNEAELDGLPDSAVSQRFEDLSYDLHCVFWPTERQAQPRVADTSAQTPEGWAPAGLDPATGVVRTMGPTGQLPDGQVRGWLFRRGERQDRHRRGNQQRGTNVPYQCPSCETDYSPRRIDSSARLSPIRHFRTGFAKTTQLLATEVFDLLKLHSKSPKLVSFSDSRQDAAKAALDVESRHHEDVRRDVVVSALRQAQQSGLSATEIDDQLAALRDQRRKAEDAEDVPQEQRLTAEIDRLRKAKAECSEGSVRLGDILEDSRQAATFFGAREVRQPLKPLIRAFVSLGIHPIHPAGTFRLMAVADGETRWFEWHELFEKRDEGFDWRDDVQIQQWLDQARRLVVEGMQKLVNEILFSRTYFSLEEAGLGHLCLPRQPFGADERAHATHSAFLRVFGDAYRLLHSPYDRTPDPWPDENAIPRTNRVLKFANQLWAGGAAQKLRDVLDKLVVSGHRDGLLATAALRVRLASPSDDYWRCGKCARVHLHRGAGICSRCLGPLAEAPNGKVSEIVGSNFLAKRLARTGSGPFRLHCEELTGQTDDGAARQRKFRGILFPEFKPARDANGNRVLDEDGDEVLIPMDRFFMPEREEIDLLAVTTTMEVGIDIGPLQAILQANMPPQRFNSVWGVLAVGDRPILWS